MSAWPPAGFSWIDPSHLGALARPYDVEDLIWLRQQGIQLIITLTESPLRSDWLDEAGLLAIHAPIEDMHAPVTELLELCVSSIQRARDQGFGVAVHCAAGLGRTGTVLAAYLVAQGESAETAIQRIREMRPGSVETTEQELAVHAYAQRLRPDASN